MMRTSIFMTILMACTAHAMAQPPGGGRGGPGGGPPPGQRGQGGQSEGGPPNAVLAALDADGDHVISAEEILNAAAALKNLDANKDGKLSSDEIHGDQEHGDQGRQSGSGTSRNQRQGGPGQGGPGQGGPGQGGPGQGGPGQGGPPTAAGFMKHAATFDFNRDGVLNRAELEKMAVAFVAEMTRQGPPGGGRGPGGQQGNAQPSGGSRQRPSFDR